MPVDLSQFQGQYSPEVIAAAQNIFNTKPDQEQVFTTRYGGDLGAWLSSFEDWWTNNYEQVMNRMGTEFRPEAGLLDALGFEFANEAGDQTMPIEQALYNLALNDYLLPDIAADEQRRQDAQDIIASYAPAIDSARGTVNDLLNGNLLQSEYAASSAAAQAQLAALNEQVASLTAGLDGELSARAASLQQQLAELAAGLDTYTAAQKQALAAQMAANFESLQQEIDARRANLSTAIDSMGQALTTEQLQRKQALQAELDALNAAQEPVNQMRLQGAEALATAVNIGAQSTRDQIVADMARQGYVGGSTGTDAAITRATVAARQEAAKAIADAKLANAQDTAGIARYGAGETRSIDDTLAQARRELDFYGATEGRSIGDYGAGERRTLADYGAGQTRTIADNDAGARLSLSNFGAGERRSLADFGASQTRGISDAAATDRRGIADADASRRLGFFSNDVARRLSALSLPEAAINSEFNIRRTAEDYGRTGLNRSLDTLNWWNLGTSGGAPTGQPYFQQPQTNGYENLGAGLLSIAGNIGNANNWWTADKSGIGAKTTYADFIANNPNSPAATGSLASFAPVQTDWS